MYKIKNKLLFRFLFIILYLNIVQCDVIVETINGRIQGSTFLNQNNEQYYGFQSIPYAKPPIGSLRFKAPQEAEPWEGILNGTKTPSVCPQFYYEDLIGDEDCLYLNVYIKSVDTENKNHVMVYIHGGGYVVGSGNIEFYKPDFLMTENIVLVTIDYRLGYLGTLSFKDQTQGVPGNANLKDQVMALRWVQANIGAFGGDKNSVTIFGESVGGASVHMHMLSPMSKGLVHKVIAESGCALNPWNRGHLGTGHQIGELFGITDKSTAEVIKELQEIPMEKFVRRVQEPSELSVRVDVPNKFGPVIELQTNEPAFISKSLPDLVPEASKIPLMLGYNNNDTLIMQVTRRLYTGKPHIFTDFNETIPSDLDLSMKERNDLITSIRQTFFEPNLFKDIKANTEYAMGPWFITGYNNAIEKHLSAGHDVFMYMFSSDNKLNFFKRSHPITATYPGASHMDELGHMFRTPQTPCFDKNSLEDKSWQMAVKIWTNFAKYGKPTTAEDNVQLDKLNDAKNLTFLNIHNDEISIGNHMHEKMWKFWIHVYETYKQVSTF